jgi:hypothetical protein
MSFLFLEEGMEVFTFSLENFSRRILMVNVIGLPGA